MKGDSLLPLYGPRAIGRAVRGIAAAMDRREKGSDLLLVGVLKGSFVFLADLVRELERPVAVDFVQTASYGGGTRPGRLRLVRDVEASVAGRRVVVVDDIVDTGRTVNFVADRMMESGARSCRVCALLDKPSRREVEATVDYCGFVIPDAFVVGYGLDFDERFRQLPGLYILREADRS